MVRQALVICVMVPPIHLGAWSMLWLPFELLLLLSGACAKSTKYPGITFICMVYVTSRSSSELV